MGSMDKCLNIEVSTFQNEELLIIDVVVGCI